MAQQIFPRVIERLVESELLPEFPAIFVVGPRGCGKTTSMRHFADTVLDLSIPGVRAAANEDPDGILANSTGRVLVDEWQEAPEILGAIKRAVDADMSGTPGKFIVTGSVRAAHQAATWPGTGRLTRVRMFGLTQGELEDNDSYNPIDKFFSQDASPFAHSDLTRQDYLSRIVAGRFPDGLSLGERGRARWFNGYVEQLVDLDATQIAGGNPRARKLRAVLDSCVARTAQELNKEATARDADVAKGTADSYITLLEDLSIIVRVPAWHSKRLLRLNRAPKIHIVDPGLAAHLMNATAASLTRDATLVGQLFETFVATELSTHIETAAESTRMFHLRSRDGNEVDVILERHGQVVGIEVKSSTQVDRRDAKGLLWLRDKLGDDFRFGAVIYSGQIPFQIDDKVWALPMSSLWRDPGQN
jgi:uncharacterized protein